MNTIKSLILGSAAVLAASVGAQAADLPLKAKAVQYVKICSLYGAGFYYIPGTETCIKLGGYQQFDVGIHAGSYDNPYYNGGSALHSRDMDYFQTRMRTQFTVDTRTATEYGVLRTYADTKFQFTTNADGVAGGTIEVDYGFVQFAGFTFGKTVSAYSTPWHSAGANNNTSGLLGGHDNATGVNSINYTWQLGNGVSAQLGIEDPKGGVNGVPQGYDRSFLISAVTGFASPYAAAANAYGGNVAPDITGNIRVDNAAFTVQLSGAAHQLHGLYYGTTEPTGHPDDTWGFAVQGGLQIKNLPTGPGDKFTIDVGYADGANRYVLGGTTGNSFSALGKTGDPAAYQSTAFGVNADGVFGATGKIEKTRAFGVRGGYVHNWNQYWESDVFGSYTKIDYNANATAILCATAAYARTAASTCNPDFGVYQIGTRLGWTPVQNLTFGAEVMYSVLDQYNTGYSTVATANTFKPAGAIYEFKDQGIWSGNLRVRRTW